VPSRRSCMTGAAASIAVALVLSAPAHARERQLSATELQFMRAVNDVRAEHRLPPVRLDQTLVRAARHHSSDMVARQYFAHGNFAGRLARFGASGPVVGENLGWSVDDEASIGRVIAKWLASPSHRAIMLRRGFRLIGVGVRRGAFMGRGRCVVVTTDFQGR
jgi:uncharacterized protein YkwD